jgi:hypothetical protein
VSSLRISYLPKSRTALRQYSIFHQTTTLPQEPIGSWGSIAYSVNRLWVPSEYILTLPGVKTHNLTRLLITLDLACHHCA